MPQHRVPWRSGKHREAAIALYRALLGQIRAFPTDNAKREEIQNVVRNRFRDHRHSQSRPRLTFQFQAGYEALSHLDAAATGDGTSKSHLLRLIDRTPEDVKRPPPPRPLTKREKRLQKKAAARETVARLKPASLDIMSRSLPASELSGRRHIPVLVNAKGVPMLRMKKPQPQWLSYIIRSKHKRYSALVDRGSRLHEELVIARLEDEWDGCMIQAGVETALEEREEAWQKAPRLAISQLWLLMQQLKEKDALLAARMQSVVDRETALKEKEDAERNTEEEQSELFLVPESRISSESPVPDP